MEQRGRRRARFIHLGRGAEENENGGHRFFFFAPFSSPSLHLLLFIRPLFFFFSLPLCPLLFFRAQYDAITGKNGKTFPPAPAVSIITVFPACRPQVIVRDPLSPILDPFFLWITPERSFVPSCTHDPRIQFTFSANGAEEICRR